MKHLLIGLVLGISLAMAFIAQGDFHEEPVELPIPWIAPLRPIHPLPPMPRIDGAPKTFLYQDLKPC